MNRLLWIGIISSCLLILTGCHHKDHDHHDHTVDSDTPTPVVPPVNNPGGGNGGGGSGGEGPGDIVSCEAAPSPIKKFVRVQLTYGLLDEGAFLAGESGGTLPLTITSPASEGATTLSVDSTVSLVDKQLLTYLGTNNRYHVAQIASTTDNIITLTEPLRFDIAAGTGSLWNFYDDEVHPNQFGSRALADFSFNSAFSVLEPNKVHVLLGDSWFKRNGESPVAERLLERLPSGSVIQNEGIGGYSLCGLLGRVDGVIDSYNPDYVWISSSINDSFDEVTQEQYKARLQTLIHKVQASGAIAIVWDPAPGILNQATDAGVSFTVLSQRYATQIFNLLAEAD